jgi:hypothetical protein
MEAAEARAGQRLGPRRRSYGMRKKESQRVGLGSGLSWDATVEVLGNGRSGF